MNTSSSANVTSPRRPMPNRGSRNTAGIDTRAAKQIALNDRNLHPGVCQFG